jgi:hypothetical protein
MRDWRREQRKRKERSQDNNTSTTKGTMVNVILYQGVLRKHSSHRAHPVSLTARRAVGGSRRRCPLHRKAGV